MPSEPTPMQFGAMGFRIYRTSEEACPKCGVSLQGEPIPKERWDDFGATHYSRKIGRTDPVLDRVTEWLCPDCGHGR